MALLRIPISPIRGTIVDYKGAAITFSKVRYNPYLGPDGGFVLDISWNIDKVITTLGGVTLTAGINHIQQFPSAPLASLLVLSKSNARLDPVSSEDVQLYIKDSD